MKTTQNPCRIRPLTRADEPVWRQLWTAYLEFYRTEVSEAIYAETFARLISDDPHEFSGLLAEVDGQPLGLAHYLSHRSNWQVENVVYLQDLYVAPEARGTGMGRALIEAVYQAADVAGTPSVYWLTAADNVTARQLYDRVSTKTPFIKYKR